MTVPGAGCWNRYCFRRFTHKSINKNLVLTTFMFKKRSFILRLCRKSLRGRRFVTRKKVEKKMGWANSPLRKRRADFASRGRPLFCISASLSSQRCFFCLSLYLVQSEACAKNNDPADSPRRILFRAFSEPSRTHLRGNSPFTRGRDLSQNWTQTENPRWFYDNNHVS